MIGIWTSTIIFIISFIIGVITTIYTIKIKIDSKEEKKATVLAAFLGVIGCMVSYFTATVPVPTIYPLDNDLIRFEPLEVSFDSDYGLKVHYSIDGTDPKDGELYTDQIKLYQTQTIAARASFFIFWSDIVKSHFTINAISMYRRYPQIPDFGAICGYTLLDTRYGYDDKSWEYEYNYQIEDKNIEDYINKYTEILEGIGFTFHFKTEGATTKTVMYTKQDDVKMGYHYSNEFFIVFIVKASESNNTEYITYEEYPLIPDFGAICGYTLFNKEYSYDNCEYRYWINDKEIDGKEIEDVINKYTDALEYVGFELFGTEEENGIKVLGFEKPKYGIEVYCAYTNVVCNITISNFMYEKYPQVPDFGAICGYMMYSEQYLSEDTYMYIYNSTDNETFNDNINGYEKVLQDCGFVQYSEAMDNIEDIVLYAYLKDNMMVWFTNRNGYYVISILSITDELKMPESE